MTRDDDVLQVAVIEDEALIIMDLESMIEDAGHGTIASAQSLRGLERMDKSISVDLAFVDLQLTGGSSGLDAADYIRGALPNALIVFVTANARMLLPDIAKDDALMPKPFTHRIIMNTLLFLNEGIRTPPPKAGVPNGLFMNLTLEERLLLV